MALRLIHSASEIASSVRRSVDGLIPVDEVPSVAVTHYGPQFNGQSLGCRTGKYSSSDGSIIAVGPERDAEWPCGTLLRVCGPGGCLVGARQDGCPGCDAYHIDVSEEGLYLVCGPGSGVCRARVEVLAPACSLRENALVTEVAGVQAGNRPLTVFTTLAEIALKDRTANLLELSGGSVLSTGPCTAQTR